MSHTYKPSYVWPNPSFPFRLYLDHTSCRIFIIENIQHNWNWLSEYHTKFRETDYFFVYCGWYHGKEFAQEARALFDALQLKRESFYFMFNSQQELENFKPYGFVGQVINHNAWLDETLVMRPLDLAKRYDAIYVARRSKFKRHMLAANVRNLALVAGGNHGKVIAPILAHRYLNPRVLSQEEVCLMINQSRCGLILSEVEGACFSSAEYLLCGVPVVSTPSLGGRDIWFNEHNSIVCEPNATAVANAVDEIVSRPIQSYEIRQSFLDQARTHRQRFILQLGYVFNMHDYREHSPEEYFQQNYFHKMRQSCEPDFDSIFV